MEKILVGIFFLFCLVVSPVEAQEGVLTGIITDGVYNVPLFPAEVSVCDQEWSCITNLDGRYELSLPVGIWELRFSSLGLPSRYKTIEIVQDTETRLDLTLGGESFYSESSYDKEANRAMASIIQLKKDFIRTTNFQFVDQVLDYVPGVDMVGGQLNIRGSRGFAYGTGSNVTVLLNGIPILRAESALPDWDFLPMSYLEEIEVIKGASSVLYGSSAIGGIINLRTKKVGLKPRSWVSVSSGLVQEPNALREDAQRDWWQEKKPYNSAIAFGHERPLGERFAARVSGNLFRENRWRKGEGIRSARLATAISYRHSNLAKTRFTASISSDLQIGRSSEMLIWNGLGKHMYESWPSMPMIRSESYKFVIDPSAQITHEAGGLSLQMRARYYNSFSESEGSPGVHSQLLFGDVQGRKAWRNDLSLVLGLSANYNFVDSGLYPDDPTKQSISSAAYLHFEKEFFERLSLSAGARFEARTESGNRQYYSEPVARLGANYNLGNSTFIRASYGQAFRFPTFSEQYAEIGLNETLFIFPNDSLLPERGWSSEIGCKQLLNFFGWHGSLDLAFFHNKTHDITEFKFAFLAEERKVGFQAQNIDEGTISGLELGLDMGGRVRNAHTRFWIGYCNIRPRYSDNNTMTFRFEKSLKAHASIRIKKIELSNSLRYRSRMARIDTPFLTIFRGLREYRNQNASGEAVVDSRLIYDLDESTRIMFICNNLLNNVYAIRPGLIESPRNFQVKLLMKIS